jgi:hypothetical protein
MDWVIEVSGIPDAIPTKMAVIKSEMKALILSFNTMKSSSATAEITIRISTGVAIFIKFRIWV